MNTATTRKALYFIRQQRLQTQTTASLENRFHGSYYSELFEVSILFLHV